MFTSIYNCSRFSNPMLSDICKKSTNEYIRRITEKYKAEKEKYEKNKVHINSKLISSIVLNSDKNNNTPNPIFPIFCFISIAYIYYTFYKKIK